MEEKGKSLSPILMCLGTYDGRESDKAESREKKLQRMSVVQAFMEQSGFDADELKSVLNACVFAKTPFLFDILYADGTVSKMPDLSKEAVAVKIPCISGNGLWLRLKTSYPQQMTAAETRRYLDELPAVNGKKWRSPTLWELDTFIHRTGDFILVARLCLFFVSLPFFDVREDDPDGQSVCVGTSDGYCLWPFFPGVRSFLADEDTTYCWPVCDV